MAIVDMNRIEILALSKDQKALLHHLQQLGCLEFEETSLENLPEGLAFRKDSEGPLKKQLERISWGIGQLSPFQKEKAPLFANKPLITREGLQEVLKKEEELMGVITSLEKIEKQRGEIKGKALKFFAQLEQLKPWENLAVDPIMIKDSAQTVQLLGTMTNSNLQDFEQHWANGPLHIEKIGIVRDLSYILLIAHKNIEESFFQDLRSAGFIQVTLEKGKGSPKEQMAAITIEEKNLEKEEEEAKGQVASYSSYYKELQILFDGLSAKEQREETSERLLQTQTTFYAKGWVPQGLGEQVKEEITNISPSAQVVLSAPKEEEEPPVFLHNNKAVTPFESVVTGFSLPDYRGLDPTAVMMPFFLNFFGMMVSDAGYGLLMAVLIPIIIKMTKPATSTKRLMQLLAMGGGATVIWGFLYNTWFGFSPLPTVFDAINNPMPVMAVCIGLGAVHLFAGLGVAAYMNIKRGKPLDAIYDQLSWFLLVVGAGLLLLPQAATIGKYMALTGVAIILLTAGRGKGKNPIKRLIGGLGALYGVTSWVSDLLSYMRLFGMGLATGVIGMVINQLVGMVFGAGFIGIILGSVLFCGGHLFNAGINVLGAYVHSCRLQYIEFFGKFYEDGGRPFKPLVENTRYVNINEANKAA